jgi:hypothetical protein
MPSFEHKKLLERISRLNTIPNDPNAFAEWLKAEKQLALLMDNAQERELVLYASGPYFFVHALAVRDDKLVPVNENDLLKWSCNPYRSVASYVSGGGRPDTWIERGLHHVGADTFQGGHQFVFGRSFEGLRDNNSNYFEILQEYAHLTGIHWRPEHHAYCRFDGHGDFEPVVSITRGRGHEAVTLVSFKREPLEQYLAVSAFTLVRLFDFTLYRPTLFNGWPEGPEKRRRLNDELFFRQKVAGAQASYTRGVQIVRPNRSRAQIFSAMQGEWSGNQTQHVEFIAHDWRNGRAARISTDPAATTNYFQAEGNSLPFEVTPAFFRPDVLLKYKADRDKYNIDSRQIGCRGAWTLRNYDVNEAGQVHTYICYLRDLPYEEQLYWASYNEHPKAPISKRALTTDFDGVPYPYPDSLQRVLSIVRHLTESAPTWWKLRDDALTDRLSIPRTTSRDEWAEAFMDLSKLIIEGFETEEIRRMLSDKGVEFDSRDQSIVLLEKLLISPTSAPQNKLIGLRTVQQIRSKAKGHASGREGAELATDALTEHGSYGAHFEHVCALVADELGIIEGVLNS